MSLSIIYELGTLVRKTGPFRGRGYLAHRLYHKKFKQYKENANHASEDWNLTLIDGSKLTAPDTSSQTWVALFTGDYGCKVVSWLSQFIEDDSVILDIGACFGFYAVPLALQKKSCKLVAFEPFPGNLKYLYKNIKNNNLEERTLVKEMGLGAEEKVLRMSTTEMGMGNAFVVEDVVPKFAMELHEVQINRLDNVDLSDFIGNKKCSFIKVDCEGFDLNTLIGGSHFIKTHRPVIFGEFSTVWMEHYKQDPNKDIHDFAAEHQYNVYEVKTTRPSKLFDSRQFALKHLTSDQSRTGESLVLMPKEKPYSA